MAFGVTVFGTSVFGPPSLGQVPSLVTSPPPSQLSGTTLPSGVVRYGDLEVSPVFSPYTGEKLFLVAAPAILDRESPPDGFLPAEARAANIQGRLRLAFRRIIQAERDRSIPDLENPPQVNVATLNQTPVLVLSDQQASRNLALVTVTEQDSAFHGKTRETLAEDWQAILQAEIDQVYRLNQPQLWRRRIFYGLSILLGLVVFTLLMWLLRRLCTRRQDSLRLRKQEEDQTRASLLSNTAAQQDPSNLGAFPPEDDPGSEAVPSASEPVAPAAGLAGADPPPLPNPRAALLTSLRQKFSLQRRIRFYTLLKWLLFWATVLAWYGGAYAIANTIPFLMRWQFWILSTPLRLLLIWFAVGLAIRISHALIDASTIKRFSTAIPTEFTANPAEDQRRELQASTITGALEGLATVVLIGAGIVGTLDSFNIPTGSILAGGAILGLAISFGSQSLVKDLVNGTLILLEDQFAVGDVVDIDGDAGMVENVNLRVTQIRNTQGELITIPNSGINRVKNLTRLWSRVDFTVEIAYENDINAVMDLLEHLAQEMYLEHTWSDLILEPPQMLGVDQISHAGMLIRLWIKTAPMQQWVVGREFRRRVRCAFEQHNISIGRPEWISYNTGWGEPKGQSSGEGGKTAPI